MSSKAQKELEITLEERFPHTQRVCGIPQTLTHESEPDVLVAHLAIERAGDYNLIGRPVVHDGLVRLQVPRHSHD